VPNVGLMQLSKLDDPSYNGQGLDARVNHFHPHNHEYIHQQILQWQTQGTNISTDGITSV